MSLCVFPCVVACLTNQLPAVCFLCVLMRLSYCCVCMLSQVAQKFDCLAVTLVSEFFEVKPTTCNCSTKLVADHRSQPPARSVFDGSHYFDR